MSWFLKVISFLIVIAAIVIPCVINSRRKEEEAHNINRYARDDEKVQPKLVAKRFTIIPIIVAIVLFVVSCSFTIIPTGYTGVRTTFGQIDESTVQNGFNWKLPFVQSIERVNNKQQDVSFDSDKVWSETKERTAIFYEGITLTYQINPEKSAWIYANVSNYRDALVSHGIVASAIKASSKSLADADATNRAIVEPLVVENLQKALDEKYGENVVCINKVTISNADFEDSYNQAIAAKQQAQLEAEQQAIENKRAIEKAEADAVVKKTKAEADANAKLVSAQAEAEANKLLEKSLTDQILREKYIEKWDGKLPQVVADDSATLMIPSVNGE